MPSKKHSFLVDTQFFSKLNPSEQSHEVTIKVDTHNKVVKSFRIDLKPLKYSDIEEYYKLYSDPAVMEKYCEGTPRDKEQVDKLMGYYLEQKEFKHSEKYTLYPNSQYGAAYNTRLPGLGVNPGQVPWNKFSNNAVDIESFLFGVDSTNLVNPAPPLVAELKNLETSKELENKDKELEETKREYKKFIVNQSNKVITLEKDEYIYGTTNNLNALSNINKFGKSKNLISRLSNFNINSLDENDFYHFLAVKCYNSTVLESLIHALLKPFNYKNELYQLHSVPLTTGLLF